MACKAPVDQNLSYKGKILVVCSTGSLVCRIAHVTMLRHHKRVGENVWRRLVCCRKGTTEWVYAIFRSIAEAQSLHGDRGGALGDGFLVLDDFRRVDAAVTALHRLDVHFERVACKMNAFLALFETKSYHI